MWGAPYGLTKVMAVGHLEDPIGTHWDTKRPASAPRWLTAKLQVERSPPRTPMGTFGDPKDPRDPPKKNPKPPPPPQKTHRAIWVAPYRLPEVMAFGHLEDPIGTH